MLAMSASPPSSMLNLRDRKLRAFFMLSSSDEELQLEVLVSKDVSASATGLGAATTWTLFSGAATSTFLTAGVTTEPPWEEQAPPMCPGVLRSDTARRPQRGALGTVQYLVVAAHTYIHMRM